MKTPNLIREYEQSVNNLVKAFCQKQYVKFDMSLWSDKNHTTLIIKGCDLSFYDIYFDMKTEQPKGMIFEWYDYYTSNRDKPFINYESYCSGLRFVYEK